MINPNHHSMFCEKNNPNFAIAGENAEKSVIFSVTPGKPSSFFTENNHKSGSFLSILVVE